MTMKFTHIDVLKRAREILSREPSPLDIDPSCNSYCIYCAIAEAKDELDKETGVVLRFSELNSFSEEHITDRPLIIARDIIRAYIGLSGREPTELKESIEILDELIILSEIKLDNFKTVRKWLNEWKNC